MRRCLFRRAYARLELAVDGIFPFGRRDGFAEDLGNLVLLELARLATAGARCRHILALDIGDGDAILVVIAILDVPAHVGRHLNVKADATVLALEGEGPNVTGNTRNSHKNLRPFKGE